MSEAAAKPALHIDLHCHTTASHDCVTPLEEIPPRLISRGIHVQAITDHDQIWGAQKLQELVAANPDWQGKLTVIVGEEVSTREGEVIGLYLTERVPPGLSAEDTVREIKRQGGLVSLPHGFDPLKRHRLRPTARERIAEQIDIVEVFNARISHKRWNVAAEEWARARGKALGAGSDSHTWLDLGCCAAESEWRGPVASADDLLKALAPSRIRGEWTHPVWAFVAKARYWLQRKLGLPN